jgi:TRAP-type C4-dicarboxylate transport system permease small subunit
VKKVKVLQFIDARIEEIIIVVSLAFMSILIGFQVFMRYIMASSLSWSEELGRYIFILVVNIGISYAVKMKKHIRVEVFTQWLPGRLRMFILIISDFIFLAFAVMIVFCGSDIALKIFNLNQNSPALEIPMGIIYAFQLCFGGRPSCTEYHGRNQKFQTWRKRGLM